MPTVRETFIEIGKYLFQSVGIVVVLYVAEKYFDISFATSRLKQENFINAKKDAYFEAIQVANKVISNEDLDSINLATGKVIDKKFLHKHTTDLSSFEMDVNTAYDKLILFSPDTTVPNAYFRVFVNDEGDKNPLTIRMQKFVEAVRNEIGNANLLPEDYKIFYIAMPSKDTLKVRRPNNK